MVNSGSIPDRSRKYSIINMKVIDHDKIVISRTEYIDDCACSEGVCRIDVGHGEVVTIDLNGINIFKRDTLGYFNGKRDKLNSPVDAFLAYLELFDGVKNGYDRAEVSANVEKINSVLTQLRSEPINLKRKPFHIRIKNFFLRMKSAFKEEICGLVV